MTPSSGGVQRVYFEPLGYIDQSQREMFELPPEGYEFVVPPATLRDRVVTSDTFLFRLYAPLRSTFPLNQLPTHLLKAWLDSRSKRPPAGTDLTYAYNHVVFRDEPWVCLVEHPTMLVAPSSAVLRRWRAVVERRLVSEWCRKVIVWSEAGKQSLLANLDGRAFAHKLDVVPLAVRPRQFVRRPRSDARVKLLFVGSGNGLGAFHLKGGKETIEAFARLAAEHEHLEFTVRSDMPAEWKARCRAIPRLRLIDRRVPWPELEREYETADIFVHPPVFPGHHVAVLDAMTYELPVIATDYGDTRERVRDGETGYLIPPSPRLPPYGERLIAVRQTSQRAAFDRANRTTDEHIVRGIVERARVLIEDPALRARIGAAARREVDDGPLSLRVRNERLQRVFDEALAAPDAARGASEALKGHAA